MEETVTRYNYINERILPVDLKTKRGLIAIMGIYSPEEDKREELKCFMRIQKISLMIYKLNYIILAGDLNTHAGNHRIQGIIGDQDAFTILNNKHFLLDMKYK